MSGLLYARPRVVLKGNLIPIYAIYGFYSEQFNILSIYAGILFMFFNNMSSLRDIYHKFTCP